MGARGPVPKRSDQRRRQNKKPELEKVATSAGRVPQPAASDGWHAAARAWYDALALSGQSRFYEPSDWAVAFLIAESMSRDLKPQVVGIVEETGEPVLAVIPLKGASLGAYLKAMTSLLVTEGDRRRVSLELQRGTDDSAASGGGADVPDLDAYRRRLSG